MSGDVGCASLAYILRDHDRERFEARKETMRGIERRMRDKYGEDAVTLTPRDQYYNMAEVLRECPEVLEKARAAIREAGLAPVSHPVRGGDGRGPALLPGPALPEPGDRGGCFHGPYEHASVQRMDRAAEILLGIVRKYAEG